MELKVGQIWKHYKGGMYRIVTLAVNNQSDELYDAVVYQDTNDESKIWTQSKDRFLSNENYNSEAVPRFTFIGDNKIMSDSDLKSARRKSIKIGFITIGVIVLLVLIYGLLVATHWSDM